MTAMQKSSPGEASSGKQDRHTHLAHLGTLPASSPFTSLKTQQISSSLLGLSFAVIDLAASFQNKVACEFLGLGNEATFLPCENLYTASVPASFFSGSPSVEEGQESGRSSSQPCKALSQFLVPGIPCG